MLNLMRQMVFYKYQMSSWPVTFYPRPLIPSATYLSKHLFLRNHWAVWWSIHWIVLGHLTKMDATAIYGKTKYLFIISCSWPWPILTLLRRSGERLRTFRSSSLLMRVKSFAKCSHRRMLHRSILQYFRLPLSYDMVAFTGVKHSWKIPAPWLGIKPGSPR